MLTPEFLKLCSDLQILFFSTAVSIDASIDSHCLSLLSQNGTAVFHLTQISGSEHTLNCEIIAPVSRAIFGADVLGLYTLEAATFR